MNLRASVCRRLVKVLSRVDDPEARELVAECTPRRQRKGKRDLQLSGRSQQQRSAALDAETSKLRVVAIRRCVGFGELSGDPLDETAELCHLDGGHGTRRQHQWIGNVVMETHENHQGPNGFDRKPMQWLPFVRAHCKRYGYPLPERFRRLEIREHHRERMKALRAARRGGSGR
jgi:hypothetical protein